MRAKRWVGGCGLGTQRRATQTADEARVQSQGPCFSPRLTPRPRRRARCAFALCPSRRQGVEFSHYMREEGYNIIPISAEHQLVRARTSARAGARVGLGLGAPRGTLAGFA